MLILSSIWFGIVLRHQRICAYLWKFSCGHLLTNVGRKIHYMTIDATCICCGAQEETIMCVLCCNGSFLPMTLLLLSRIGWFICYYGLKFIERREQHKFLGQNYYR
jgi:hypothetical protein